MANETKIEWCDSTFNPWIGCTKVSPACDHCYAAVSTPARTQGVEWGAGKPRRRTSPGNWNLPLRWNAQHAQFVAEHGRRRRVFCASLADVFDNEVPAQWRADLFALIRATPNLDWLLLTKRIGNAAAMMNDAASAVMDDFCGAPTWERSPWSNVWVGATVCNQAEADRDVPKLLRVPAAVRFLSVEPMLGPISLSLATMGITPAPLDFRGLHWIIAGGESGPHARPMNPQWARDLRDQCAAAGVAFLFKQWGEWVSVSEAEGHGPHHTFSDGRTVRRIGKKAAGRLLDGREHSEWPATGGGR